MRIIRSFLVPLLVIYVLLSCGCSSSTDSSSKYNPPADHTIDKDGAMHKSGLNNPEVNCVSCHGGDLHGGSTGVSCFECHDKKW